LHRKARGRGETELSDLEVLTHLDSKAAFLNDLAIIALSSRNIERTADLLREAIMHAESHSQLGVLATSAKIAFAADFREITTEALPIAGRIALRIENPAERAVELSFVSALQHELAHN